MSTPSLKPLVGRPQPPASNVASPSAGLRLPSQYRPTQSQLLFLATIAVFVAAALCAYFAPPLWKIGCMVALLGAFVLMAGQTISGRPLGFLINENNVMSLSRLQLTIWTIVIAASYGAFAFARIQMAPHPDAKGIWEPLGVQIDPSLLILLGISAASFVASPAIQSGKKDKEPDTGVVEQAARLTDDPTDTVEFNRDGILYANSKASEARFTDVFQGDELGDTTQVDLAKVQMFVFTAIVAGAYLTAVIKDLQHSSGFLASLPTVPNQLNAILGISHAGYLGSKTITHTAVQK